MCVCVCECGLRMVVAQSQPPSIRFRFSSKTYSWINLVAAISRCSKTENLTINISVSIHECMHSSERARAPTLALSCLLCLPYLAATRWCNTVLVNHIAYGLTNAMTTHKTFSLHLNCRFRCSTRLILLSVWCSERQANNRLPQIRPIEMHLYSYTSAKLKLKSKRSKVQPVACVQRATNTIAVAAHIWLTQSDGKEKHIVYAIVVRAVVRIGFRFKINVEQI